MFDDLENKSEQKDVSPAKIVGNNRKHNIVPEPDDMFSAVDKVDDQVDKQFGIKNKKEESEKRGDVASPDTPLPPRPSLVGILAMDSLPKFLMYILLAVLVIGVLSFWIANNLTVNL